MNIALSSHSVESADSLELLFGRLRQEASDAADVGKCEMIVYPEYGALEMSCLLPTDAGVGARFHIEGIQKYHNDWVDAHRAWAKELGITVVAGSFPLILPDGRTMNRVWIARPDGALFYQDKVMMTRFEREVWGVQGGDEGLKVIDLGSLKAVVAICYDVEFPVLVRRATEAGATLILTPSDTETWHGYWRVCTGARARAMENQCYAAMVPLVGAAPWTSTIDVNVGRAGIFGPIDAGFPEDGILAMGNDGGGLLTAALSPRKISSVRRHGQNHNFANWSESEVYSKDNEVKK